MTEPRFTIADFNKLVLAEEQRRLMRMPPKIFKLGRLFWLARSYKCFWFRLFGGPGIAGKHIGYNRPLFSERNGYTKYWQVGKWRFTILKRRGV